MPLSLVISEGADLASKLGVSATRRVEIVTYVTKMIQDHTKRNLSVPDTIYEISIDPYFKTDAEIAIAIFVVGSTRGLTLGAQPSCDALKMNAIKLIRRDLHDFLHFLGDEDGVLLVYAKYISESFAEFGVGPEIFSKLEKLAEKSSDAIFKETKNDGERTLVLCAMLATLVSEMSERADKLDDLTGRLSMLERILKEMMPDGGAEDN